MPNIWEKTLYLQPAADSVAEARPQPRKVYGRESYVVQSYTSNVGIGLPRQNIALFDFKFGLPLLLFILLFIFIISFRKGFSKLVGSFISFKKFWSYQRAQIWGELPFFMLLFLFTIFPLSLLLTELTRSFFSSFSEEMFADTFLLTCAGVSLFMLLRLICYRLIGAVTREKQLFSDLIYTQLIFFAVEALIVVPVFLVRDFLDESISDNILFPLSLFLLGIFCLYFFRTIRLFLHEKTSFFLWILYFCTLEILPLTIIFKFLEEA